ncbi:MAG: ATP-binding protein [Chlamydiota bacterium]|nr:ATP-binding protein [Chlamydiota bacterium]
MKDQIDNEFHAKRILFVEKFIMMPVKTGAVFLASMLFFASDPEFADSRTVFFYQTNLYVMANLFFYFVLVRAQRQMWSIRMTKIAALFLSITDNLYLSFLIYLTDGLESPLYWAYGGLIIRNAVIFPRIREQSFVNLALCAFYAGAVLAREQEVDIFLREVFYLKLMVLALVSICCWGISVLIQKKAVMQAEGREIFVRKQKMVAIRRMAGDLAHELKNPLAIINTASFYLQQKLSASDEKILKELDIIRSEIARADMILSRLMDYSKLESARLVRVFVNNAIEVILQNLHPEIAYPNVKIIKQFMPDLPPLLMDKKHWHQIISNLLINAFEAVADVGEKSSIMIATSLEKGNIIKIVITDNGVGIAEEHLEQVFKSFYTTKHKGTGLGLSIVKNLVETYDGQISLKSTVGLGTDMILHFPTILIKD